MHYQSNLTDRLVSFVCETDADAPGAEALAAGEALLAFARDPADAPAGALPQLRDGAAVMRDDYPAASAIDRIPLAVAVALLRLDGEWQGTQGGGSPEPAAAELLIGSEIAVRLARYLEARPELRGWYPPGVVTGIGVAAACARRLGLDADQTRVAMAVASTQGSGLASGLGTEVETLIFGHAIDTGIEAALLARAGFDAPADPIGGRRGVIALMLPGADLAEAVSAAAEAFASLGRQWRAVAPAGGAIR